MSSTSSETLRLEDQAYWQRAIASRPGTTVKAYLLGGLAWCVDSLGIRDATGRSSYAASPSFAIPFTMATTMGIAAVAPRGDPAMRVLSPADVSAGHLPLQQLALCSVKVEWPPCSSCAWL